ncbi:retrovirus-related pol polyprotein from transposon TNT 1-94 [Tanacetum coccineum]
MECLYKEDVDRIFTLDEPFKEMGSETIKVHALKEEEFAQITLWHRRLSHFHDDTLHETLYEDSTSQRSSSNVRSSHTPLNLLGKWTKNHPLANVIGDPSRSVSIRKQLKTNAIWCYFDVFLTSVESKNFKEAMLESFEIEAMQEEIHEFERLQGIDFEESFAPVDILKSIHIFIENATNKNMTIYQMDVKTAFLNSELREVVYAPRAWYDKLSSFLLSQEFSKGAVDPTLFTRKAGRDILLVQIYVDDIIFASTNPAMCDEFAKIMSSKFKMSMMGKMSFFLGLQNFQSPRGIFINQSNCALKIIKKYGMQSSDPVDTPMVDKSKLDEDLQGKPVDPTHYRGSNHIDVSYHFIKEQVENGVVELYFTRTKYQLADIFTKALPRERFNFLIEKLRMKSMSPETLNSLAEEEEE